MEDIKQMLDRLGDLSDAELTDLEDKIISTFDDVEKADRTPQVVDSMVELADYADAVKAEKANRVSQAEELSARAEEAASRVRTKAEEGDVEVEVEEDPDKDEKPEESDEEEELKGQFSEEAAPAAEVSEAPEVIEAVETPVEEFAAEVVETPEVIEAEPVAVEATEASVVETETAEEDPVPTEASTEVVEVEEVQVEQEAPAETFSAEVSDEAPAESVETPEVVAEFSASDEEGDTEIELEGTVTAGASPQDIEQPVVVPPSDRTPTVTPLVASVAITAGAEIPGVSAGSPIENMSQVSEFMTKRILQMGRVQGGDGEQSIVANFSTSYPSDRALSEGDKEGNLAKINEVRAITAAGGTCAPVNTRYELFGVGDTDRPVKDSLVNFSADRGGIRFVTPPTLADVAGAASLWTRQDDIDAATAGAPDPVKPCIRVACGAEVTVYTDAIPLCLTFGNLNTRAYPELVARHNELALVQHARFAETRLLTRIGALSTNVTAARRLSAVIDFLSQVDRAQAAYRNRHRIAPVQAMRLIAPAWMKDLLKADLAMRMPGDGIDGNLAVADAVINSFFATRNVNVTWSLDGETGQVFGTQGAGALLDFPEEVIWYLFAEGTFLFLDGGTLDLGLVRDSTLNGTNDYKMFIETFEGVAKVGLESLRVTSVLPATGLVAGTIDTSPVVIP